MRNSGPAAIGGWTVKWTFTGGQRISQSWNGTITQDGANVTAGNVSWNGSLAPNGTASFGFLASWSGGNTAPTLTCSTT
ncbi:cellulose binding domain-containing protein [Microtetraspora niveoalba]|uniref:cellulose binding domain-containing protein n=1 Tax=Microtetraspora niveoalba TaxID=46175 RepID=UPI001FDF2848|nr:cellulose binding domain-containing protein [Microtetraspora niveoalba]